MDILFIGKRFYTNRDAYTEKFGRIYQLPYYWSKENKTQLWLIDYHSKEKVIAQDEQLQILSTPIFSLSFILFFFSSIFKKPKTIVASGDCYIGIFSLILAKIIGAKFIFDVYDKYDTFSGYRNLFVINIYQLLLKKSDLCLFSSQKLMDDSQNLCKHTILVQNGVNQNHFYPRDKITSRKELNLNGNDLYIGYFGSMEVERGIDDLIEAVKLVRNEGIDLKILLGGRKREDLNLDYNFINYLGNISFSKIPIVMACCDLLALPYRNSEFLDNASSCKIAEYISMEIPIVATATPNLLMNFKFNGREIVAECNNPLDFSSKIKAQLWQKKIFFTISSFQWEDIAYHVYGEMHS